MLVVPQIDLLMRVARSMVARPAGDLVQETLARAFRSIDTFDRGHPRAWLLTIMRNIHMNMGGRRRPTLLPLGHQGGDGSLVLLGSTRFTNGARAIDAPALARRQNPVGHRGSAHVVSTFTVHGGTLTELPSSPVALPAGGAPSGLVVL